MTFYNAGDLARISVALTNVAGAAADPTALAFSLTLPDGSVLEGSWTALSYVGLVRTGVGSFYFDLFPTQSGLYRYTWTATGVVNPVRSGYIVCITPSPILDLTDLALVHSYAGVMSAADDSLIQLAITAASVEMLWRTGRSGNGVVPAVSPFIQPNTYDEWYDGSGSERQFLRQWPCRRIHSLQLGGQTVKQSTDWNVTGYAIEDGGRSIAMRSAGSFSTRRSMYSRGARGMDSGVQNLHIVYDAGFDFPPPDVVRAVTQWVAVNYKRQQWIDHASKSMSTGAGVSGTTTYRDWAIPPEVVQVIENYTRSAIV